MNYQVMFQDLTFRAFFILHVGDKNLHERNLLPRGSLTAPPGKEVDTNRRLGHIQPIY